MRVGAPSDPAPFIVAFHPSFWLWPSTSQKGAVASSTCSLYETRPSSTTVTVGALEVGAGGSVNAPPPATDRSTTRSRSTPASLPTAVPTRTSPSATVTPSAPHSLSAIARRARTSAVAPVARTSTGAAVDLEQRLAARVDRRRERRHREPGDAPLGDRDRHRHRRLGVVVDRRHGPDPRQLDRDLLGR